MKSCRKIFLCMAIVSGSPAFHALNGADRFLLSPKKLKHLAYQNQNYLRKILSRNQTKIFDFPWFFKDFHEKMEIHWNISKFASKHLGASFENSEAFVQSKEKYSESHESLWNDREVSFWKVERHSTSDGRNCVTLHSYCIGWLQFQRATEMLRLSWV